MPRTELMTWIPSEKRWKKIHQGKVYQISARALACEQTRLGSLKQANAWWVAKQGSLHPTSEGTQAGNALEASWRAFGGSMGDFPWDNRELAREAYLLWISSLKVESPKQFQMVVTELLGQPSVNALTDIKRKFDEVVAGVSPDQLADNLIERYLTMQEGRFQAGAISAGSMRVYRCEMGLFHDWFGRDRLVSSLNDDCLKGWFKHLASLNISHVTKTQRFGRLIGFLRWAWTEGKIELPRTIDSHLYSFAGETEEKALCTADMFRTALAGSSGLGRLCLLLAANCGFYWSDMARILDWSDGIIKMKRAKTAKSANGHRTYYLWDETIDALNSHGHLLGSLVVGSGEKRKIDATKVYAVSSGLPLPVKNLRHTCATVIRGSSFADCLDYFMGHKRSMAVTWYARESQDRLRLMFAHLRSWYLG